MSEALVAEGAVIAEVIAANYAYALRAGLCLIPEIRRELADELLEGFYSLYDDRSVSPTEALERLGDRFLSLTGMLPVPQGGSVTFITGGLPLGISIPQVPSTHLFKYPDLGIAMINGLAAEKPDSPGIGFVALVDPETTEAQEIAAAERLLPPRGAFIRTYFGAGANVREVTRMIELLPYDLMIVATHCGDVNGFRWTYEFTTLSDQPNPRTAPASWPTWSPSIHQNWRPLPLDRQREPELVRR